MTELTSEQKRTRMELRQQRAAKVKNAIGFVILAGALLWSVLHVGWLAFFKGGEVIGADRTVIRFAHWQLEGRTVEALDEAAREYERLHPGVEVQQIEVPERGYEQWTKTQLIGRTAPDLIELRTWKWKNLINRYFVPLATYVDKPNPYNAGTELADVPWRDTYIDGMLGGYISELQAQYGIPLSVFTIRIYANRQLMERASGSSQPPTSLREFLDICARIEAYANQHDLNIVPIAGSDYTARMFKDRYFKMATWGLRPVMDTTLDGNVGTMERLEAILSGKVVLSENRYIRAAHEVLYDISRFFNRGFMSAQRDQSVFLFAQGNAAMIATGSWDAGTLHEQVKDQFDIVVFDFPTAEPDNPRYGETIRYRVTEADARAGFSFGLTKLSQNKDQAIDFMQFLASRKPRDPQVASRVKFGERMVDNEWLNRQFRWFPAIEGAEELELLEAFKPQVRGVYEVFKMEIGSDTRLKNENLFQEYITAEQPTRNAYHQFLRAAQGSRQAFLDAHGPLARVYLEVFADDPNAYSYAEHLKQFRDVNYRSMINAYEQAFHRNAIPDVQRGLQGGYNSMANNEDALAQSRTKAMWEGMNDGLSGDAGRNLATQTFGQVKRLQGWHWDTRRLRELIDAIKTGRVQPVREVVSE